MRLIPVLDLRGGRAVHARGGDRARYAPLVSRVAPGAAPGDAVAIAGAYSALGAPRIYVADLDAIEGRAPQDSVVRACALAATARGSARVWIDAGIAAAGDVSRWVAVPGVERIIVGLESVASMDAVAEIVRAAQPKSVAFSVDLRDGVPVARDPALRSVSPVELARAAVRAGAVSVVLLDLARVGTGAGVDARLAQRVAAGIAPTEVLVGGGIRDIDAVRRLGALGVHGVLVGSALHDGRIDGRALATPVAPA
ncbi:MAG TPA: HisA/HisF-related TIM barrel protein [Gemmatimonadaceae bacterium]